MIKDFDRSIEQMMNEHAVPPPFGAWNRIAAGLDAPVAAAPRRVVPVAAIGGFVAGAMLIGGLVAGALVYNGNNLNNITYPATVAANNTTASNTQILSPAAQVTTAQQVGTVNQVAEKSNVQALVAVAADKQTGKTAVTLTSSNGKTALSNNNDVAVPEVKLKANANMVSMPYYFPAIDVANDTQAMASANDEDGDDEVAVSKANAKPAGSSEIKRRSSSSSDFRGVKFKKKKRKSFTYGNIVRTKKH